MNGYLCTCGKSPTSYCQSTGGPNACMGYYRSVPTKFTEEERDKLARDFAEWIAANAYKSIGKSEWANGYSTWGGFPSYKTTQQLLTEYKNSKP